MSFPSLRDGFKEWWRLFIRFDGYYLKGPFPNVLLSVVILDVNQGMFLIVVYVCEFKSIQNQIYFLRHLQEYLADSSSLPS